MNGSFKRVQFVGYAISTHAKVWGGDDSLYKHYQGDADEIQDVEQRLELIRHVLKLVNKACSLDRGVLRVFVIPEFFFRGKYGAYAEGDMEKRLRQGLELALKEDGENLDLSVFGTSLLARDPLATAAKEILARSDLGDDYLAVYQACKKYREASGLATPVLKEIMFYLDEVEGMDESDRLAAILELDPLSRTLLEMMGSCDLAPSLAVSNLCQIIGKDGSYRSVQKQFKSKVDFVFNRRLGESSNRGNEGAYLQTMTSYPPIPSSVDEVKKEPGDQYCRFEFAGLKFGVEVCLDHIRCRLGKKAEKNGIDIQIIPSCGVEVTESCVAARAGGLVFNCDGDYTLDNAQNGDNAHTQLFRVLEAADPSSRAIISSLIHPAEVIGVNYDVDKLYPHGAGELHIYAPEPLEYR